MLTDHVGTETFSESCGGDGDDQVFDFGVTSDGGYIIFTDSDTAGVMGENNFGLMKIVPDHVFD